MKVKYYLNYAPCSKRHLIDLLGVDYVNRITEDAKALYRQDPNVALEYMSVYGRVSIEFV